MHWLGRSISVVGWVFAPHSSLRPGDFSGGTSSGNGVDMFRYISSFLAAHGPVRIPGIVAVVAVVAIAQLAELLELSKLSKLSKVSDYRISE